MTMEQISTCKRGHVRIRGTECKECQRIRNAAYRLQDPELHRRRCQEWRRQISDEQRELIATVAKKRTREWVEANPGKAKENKRRSNASDAARARKRNWKKRHPEKVTKDYVARKTGKQQATPQWNDNFKIRVTYRTAAVLTKLMKCPFHVDHIYPLRSKYMCGLHVHDNLQILPAAQNMSKSNRRWPGQLPCQREVQ